MSLTIPQLSKTATNRPDATIERAVRFALPRASLPRTSRSLRRVAALALIASFGLGALGCSKEKVVEKKDVSAPKVQEQKPAQTKEKKAPVAKGHVYPFGPRLVFLPGEGASAIRFGATVETIQRHMEAPCDEVTNERCLYVKQAVEFFLKDGVLVRLKAHRRDRKVPGTDKEQYFGTLRGLLFPKIMLGLHRHIVVEEFGEPEKKEPLATPGQDGLVDRHTYDGVIFEYDKIQNGNVVLSAIEVFPSETAKKKHEALLNSTAAKAAKNANGPAAIQPQDRPK